MPRRKRKRGEKTKVSVLIPCLNEERTVGNVVRDARKELQKNGFEPEVIVDDGASTDDSVNEACKAGAIVIKEGERGYGDAYLTMIERATGDVFVLADGDGTYPMRFLPKFVKPILKGKDFVMGTRLKGKIEKNAMPLLHRYLGNPILTLILNLLLGASVSDVCCGMRSYSKEKIRALNLSAGGMDFAAELLIKSLKRRYLYAEVPITYKKREVEKSKLNSFGDGWILLRMMLLLSPTWLFIYPGLISFMLGLAIAAFSLTSKIELFGRSMDVSATIIGSFLAIVGIQTIFFGLSAKIYSVINNFEMPGKTYAFINDYFSLEKGLLLGTLFIICGLIASLSLFPYWLQKVFTLSGLKLGIISSSAIIIGLQVFLSSFFISIIHIKKNKKSN